MGSPMRSRRAIVTGAGSGIGKAVALRLLREGVDVLAVDIDAARLDDLASADCRIKSVDLADPPGAQSWRRPPNGADYLVNSHGIIMVKSIFDITLEDWRQVQAVNAESVFSCARPSGRS